MVPRSGDFERERGNDGEYLFLFGDHLRVSSLVKSVGPAILISSQRRENTLFRSRSGPPLLFLWIVVFAGNRVEISSCFSVVVQLVHTQAGVDAILRSWCGS